MPVVLVEAPIFVQELPRKRFTRAEVDAMNTAGIFDGQKVELIQGDLIDKMGQNPPHASAIRRCLRILAGLFGLNRLLVQAPIEVGSSDREGSQPEPDLAVLTTAIEDDSTRHPRGNELALVVEVADSSLNSDRTTKRDIYARAGVPEYWVLDLLRRQMIVHRALDSTQGKYASVESYAEHETLTIEGLEVKVEDLLPLRDQ